MKLMTLVTCLLLLVGCTKKETEEETPAVEEAPVEEATAGEPVEAKVDDMKGEDQTSDETSEKAAEEAEPTDPAAE